MAIISKEKIAKTFQGINLVIENQTYKVLSYTAGGEGITFLCVNTSGKWFLKLYNQEDCYRECRFKKMENLSCIPFKFIYVQKDRVRQACSFLDPIIINKLHDMLLMKSIPYSSWENYKSEKGGFHDPQHKYLLTMALPKLVEKQEQNQIAHRDLSHSNVFINMNDKDVVLIDWDQTFHPDMPAPQRLKRGTPCYKPTYRTEYEPYGDRFSLAVLITEFMHVTFKMDCPFFESDELIEAQKSQRLAKKTLAKKGVFVKKEERELQDLTVKTLTAPSFDRMTSPLEWINCLEKVYGHLIPKPIVIQTLKLPRRKISTLPLLPIRRNLQQIKKLPNRLTKNSRF